MTERERLRAEVCEGCRLVRLLRELVEAAYKTKDPPMTIYRITADYSRMREQVATLRADLERVTKERDEALAEADKEQRSHLSTIDERDASEDWFGKLAALLHVETEFSNLRGYVDIYNDCATQLTALQQQQRGEDQAQITALMPLRTDQPVSGEELIAIGKGLRDVELGNTRPFEEVERAFNLQAENRELRADLERVTKEREEWKHKAQTATASDRRSRNA